MLALLDHLLPMPGMTHVRESRTRKLHQKAAPGNQSAISIPSHAVHRSDMPARSRPC